MEQQSIRLICNPFLMIASFMVTICITLLAAGVIFLVGVDGIMSSPEQILPGQIAFGVLLAGFIIAIVASSPRISTVVTLSRNAVTYKAFFCKPKTYPYKHYPYIYKASYFHSNIIGVGYQVVFIIFSSKLLSKEECLNANTLSPSDDLIKIRYSKITYQKLYNILPVSHQIKLSKAFDS